MTCRRSSTIDPGDTIAFACPNAGWHSRADEMFEPRDEELDAGHALVGPVEVRGARAGQTLVVRIDEVAPAPSADVRRELVEADQGPDRN